MKRFSFGKKLFLILITEMLIILACVIAAEYGPSVIINAKHGQVNLISRATASIAVLLLVAILFWVLFISSRALERFFGKIGVFINIFIAYSALFAFEIEQFISYADHFTRVNQGKFSLPVWEYFRNLFDFSHAMALMNLPVLIILFAILLSILWIKSKNIVISLADLGIMYILPAVILLSFVMPHNPSSEGKVLFSNMILVYLFLRTATLPLIEYTDVPKNNSSLNNAA